MYEIERTVKRGANTPQTKYRKRVKGHELEILRILDSQGFPPDERFRMIHSPIPLVPVASGDVAAIPVAESGTSSVLPHMEYRTPIHSSLSILKHVNV